jgi:glycosyltransferase involved in cell wall biosynthesis
MKEVSIIIPTYKRVDLLRDIFTSLLKQSSIYEIIVVDSDSNDGTKEFVDDCNNKSNINIMHINVANSVSLKRNTGILTASQDFLIFLDDDCIPDKSFVKDHIDSLINKPNTVNCGDIFFPSLKVKASNYIRYKNSRHEQYRYSSLNAKVLDYRSIVTMNMSIKKSNILKNDLFFNESFIGYGMEDNEFGCQVTDSGMDIQSCSATIQHMESNNSFLFAKKIFHTARDGVYRFNEVNKNAAMNLRYSFFFEPDYNHRNLVIKLFIRRFEVLFNVKIAKYILHALDYVDKYKLLYFPWLYKYVYACYYLSGIKNREKAYKNTSEVSIKWYSESI